MPSCLTTVLLPQAAVLTGSIDVKQEMPSNVTEGCSILLTPGPPQYRPCLRLINLGGKVPRVPPDPPLPLGLLYYYGAPSTMTEVSIYCHIGTSMNFKSTQRIYTLSETEITHHS